MWHDLKERGNHILQTEHYIMWHDLKERGTHILQTKHVTLCGMT